MYAKLVVPQLRPAMNRSNIIKSDHDFVLNVIYNYVGCSEWYINSVILHNSYRLSARSLWDYETPRGRGCL